jgi:ubiquinone/menaquinone biosynthesis C-methylase UbiE
MSPQVKKEHYEENYDDLRRWISYYCQIQTILEKKPKKVLEIGIGNGVVSDYLKKQKIKVITCDFDKSLRPDVVADIRKLPFEKNEFDLAYACQVLEHLPWKEAIKALKELKRVSKKYVLISLPYRSLRFEGVISFNKIKKIFGREFLDLSIRIPRMTKIKFNGEHYWEIGVKGYPLRKIRKELKKDFNIKKEFSPVLNKYHQFFLLKTK